jgi:L-lactate dehydrogenase complex protein LldG
VADARHRIVASVRRSLLRAVLPGASDAPPPAAAGPGAPAQGQVSDLIASFTAALEGLTGRVYRAATAAEAAATVAAIAKQRGAASFISWDEDAIGCSGLLDALAGGGIRRVPYTVPADAASRADVLHALGGVPLGITGADAALADTGGLVLLAGPGRGRLCSLLPADHIAVVPIARLVASLPAYLAARPGVLDESSNVVVVTGPSRTADIEMTLTHGVHGPKSVHVVLVG